jgi:two-component sensor histidine kinase
MHQKNIAVRPTYFDTPASHSVPHEPDEFLLLRETHHRLANTFTMLAGMLWHEFSQYESPELRASLARCEARIGAFSNLHKYLVIGAERDWISVQNYIEHLCEALSEVLLRPAGIRCEVFADAIDIPSERCELLGLIIAELVTNAAKHAFHGRNGGLVRVALFNINESWVCVVSDNGVGTATASVGVGSKILKRLVSALGGNLVRTSRRYGTWVAVSCQMEPNHL